MSPAEILAQVGDNELIVESFWPGIILTISRNGYSSVRLEKKDQWVHWKMCYFPDKLKNNQTNHKILREFTIMIKSVMEMIIMK